MTICRSCGGAMPKPGLLDDPHVCRSCSLTEVVSGPKNFAGGSVESRHTALQGVPDEACQMAPPNDELAMGPLSECQDSRGSVRPTSTFPPSRSLTDVTKREDGQTVAPMDGRGGGFLEGAAILLVALFLLCGCDESLTISGIEIRNARQEADFWRHLANTRSNHINSLNAEIKTLQGIAVQAQALAFEHYKRAEHWRQIAEIK